jgi:predicted amidophosphoribosyltransferase
MFQLLMALSESRCRACDKAYELSKNSPLEQFLCPDCFGAVPTVLSRMEQGASLQGGWSLGGYQSPVGALIRVGKYGGIEGAIVAVGEELAHAFAHDRAVDLPVEGFDAVICAPTSPYRTFWRGFDTVEMLAWPVSVALGIPMLRCLGRYGGAPQASLKAEERYRNLRGRIRVRGGIPEGCRRVLLVDDVRTTGATLDACADALLGEGVGEVWGLVAAG